ncbi:uncharacterized protein TNCT_719331 [Trichonephila clavata]|uniref:Uncharacterized protein n=1 Tax=Trichonephila clavata TaxID=2740835 RepID=A0A8X6G096_TRICU|nr:uncharacterized protein TNCT_719331 [Trichonephila clavata]
MDDLISGCSSISSAKQFKQELIYLFSGAGMQLHKWSSDCIELLSNFDVSDGDVSLTIPNETKALGLLWRPQKDTLAFSASSIADVSDSCTITKRSVLSATARIFDPLGLISPAVTKAKLVMQELWRLKLDWNDSLPIHLQTQWERFVKSLAAINNLNIPRYILLDDALRIELHGQKNQVMADLPSNRVKVSRVFTKVGIDYAGPLFIKLYPDVQEKQNPTSNFTDFIHPKVSVKRGPNNPTQLAHRQQYRRWNWRGGQHQHPVRYSRNNVFSPQSPKFFLHYQAFPSQRPTMYPRNQRFSQQRPAALRPDAPTFHPN